MENCSPSSSCFSFSPVQFAQHFFEEVGSEDSALQAFVQNLIKRLLLNAIHGKRLA